MKPWFTWYVHFAEESQKVVIIVQYVYILVKKDYIKNTTVTLGCRKQSTYIINVDYSKL